MELEHQPARGNDDQGQHESAHCTCDEGGIERRQLDTILSEYRATVEHPMPSRVRHERREDDRAHALGDDVLERPRERMDREPDDEQLSELDPDVERDE